MLPRLYSFLMRNQTGVTQNAGAVQVFRRGWKIQNGAVTYEASQTQVYSSASTNNGAYDSGGVISNETDLFYGAEFTFTATAGAGTGPFTLYFNGYTDNGTITATNAEARAVDFIWIAGAQTSSRVFEIVSG